MKRHIMNIFPVFLGLLIWSSTSLADTSGNEADKQCFDAVFYAENNPDVVAVYGDSEERLLEHYLEYGRYEGRSANNHFNLTIYRGLYDDLRAAFGNDWDAYPTHFREYGYAEGRIAMCENPHYFEPIQKPSANGVDRPDDAIGDVMDDGTDDAADDITDDITGDVTDGVTKEAMNDITGDEGNHDTVPVFGARIKFSEKRYVINNNSINDLFYIESEKYEFDEKGNMVAHYSYGLDGNEIEHKKWEYDENGNEVAYDIYQGEEVIFSRRKEYDESGREVFFLEYDNGNVKNGVSGKREYNEDGKEVAVYSYDSDGVLYEFIYRQYDKNGNEVMTYTYNSSEARYFSTEKYEYDEDGNRLAHHMVTGLSNYGEAITSQKWEYDKKGNEIACYHYIDDEILLFSTKRAYDIYGNEVACFNYDESGKLSGSEKREYDRKGNETAFYSYDGDGNLVEHYVIENTYIATYIAFETVKAEESEPDLNESTSEPVPFKNVISIISHYDDKGNRLGISKYEYFIIENEVWSDYYRDGSILTASEKNIYDERGYPIIYCHYAYTGEGEAAMCFIYDYDEYGNKIYYAIYDDEGIAMIGESSMQWVIEVKENEVISYSADGGKSSFPYCIKRQYDNDGNIIAYYEYNEDEAMTLKRELDSNGNWIYTTYEYIGKNLSYYEVTEYDEYGYAVRSSLYMSDGTPSSYTITENTYR